MSILSSVCPGIKTVRYLDDGPDAGSADDELVEAWRYDDRGRVVQYSSAADIDTRYQYTYDNTIANNTGGWRVKTVGEIAANYTEEDIDHHGRVHRQRVHSASTDLYFSYTYDSAGRLVEEKQDGYDETGEGHRVSYEYYGNGLLKAMHKLSIGADNNSAGQSHALYEYDGNGNRILEQYTYLDGEGEQLYSQVSRAQYDALNRVVQIEDPEQFRLWYRYDEVGNRRQVYALYRSLEEPTLWEAQSDWYRYDAMNRVTISQGSLAWTGTHNAIVRGSGHQISYNGLGQRTAVTTALYDETYSYNALGHLQQTDVSSGWRITQQTDRQGRVQDYRELNTVTNQFKLHATYAYHADGRVQEEKRFADHSTNELQRISTTSYTYNADGYETVSQVQYRAGGVSTITLSTTYAWFGSQGYQKTEVNVSGATSYIADYGWKPGKAVYHYDSAGQLLKVEDEQGGRVIDFITDAQGRILSRTEKHYGAGFTLDSYGNLQYTQENRLFHFNGQQVGEVNNSGAVRRDYGQLLNDKSAQAQMGLIRPSQYGDFDQNYQAMASVGRSPGSYTADGGETLSDVARAVWGDAGLWYLIASENGLKGTETLLAGTVLRLPNVNTNLHNAAGVHKPYAPGEAIGDVSPTLVDPPQPLKQKPKKKKSGGLFKKILVVIVVVVVSYFTAGAASGWAGSLASTFSGTAATGAAAGTVATIAGNVVAYAAVGAIANAAGQLASMALGLQDGFNWSAVGKAALTGGITGGAMAGLEMLANSGSALADTAGLLLDYRDVTQAVTYNLASQSVNMALGEQRSFSWTSLAAAAIARPVSNRIAGQVGLGPIGTDLLSAVASEGIESALYGREFDWAGVAGNFVNASMMRNSASTQANRTQNEQYLDRVAARISQTGNQSPNASGWDTAPFGEVVVTARRPEDYRLYASVNDLIDQHLNGDDSLSTDMDPAFQRQGGTVAEWNRMRADYARQSQDTGPIRLSPVRVHVDAEGKFIEYPAGPGAGGGGDQIGFQQLTEAGKAWFGDSLKITDEGMFWSPQAPLGSEANPGRLEEVLVTARRDSGSDYTSVVPWVFTSASIGENTTKQLLELTYKRQVAGTLKRSAPLNEKLAKSVTNAHDMQAARSAVKTATSQSARILDAGVNSQSLKWMTRAGNVLGVADVIYDATGAYYSLDASATAIDRWQAVSVEASSSALSIGGGLAAAHVGGVFGAWATGPYAPIGYTVGAIAGGVIYSAGPLAGMVQDGWRGIIQGTANWIHE